MLPFLAAIPAYLLKGAMYLLKNPRVLLFVAIAATFSVMWLQIQRADSKLAALALENSNLRVKVELVTEEVRVQKEIVKITDGRIKEQEEAAKSLEEALEAIDSAPATDDGPVAPILQRTLDNLP